MDKFLKLQQNDTKFAKGSILSQPQKKGIQAEIPLKEQLWLLIVVVVRAKFVHNVQWVGGPKSLLGSTRVSRSASYLKWITGSSPRVLQILFSLFFLTNWHPLRGYTHNPCNRGLDKLGKKNLT